MIFNELRWKKWYCKYIKKKKKIKNDKKNKIFFIKERDKSWFIFLLQKKII